MATEEKEGPDYIHPPDVMEDDPRNGLVCFLDGRRPCGPDCMAWTTAPSESRDLNDQQKHCTVIVSIDRLGRHSGVVAKTMVNAKADAGRPSAQPPNPLGRSQ